MKIYNLKGGPVFGGLTTSRTLQKYTSIIGFNCYEFNVPFCEVKIIESKLK